jgi:hypothetical protein
MARAARIEYPEAFYRVITQGNQRQKIFYDDQDRKKFLRLILPELVFLFGHVVLLNTVQAEECVTVASASGYIIVRILVRGLEKAGPKDLLGT